MTKKKVTKSDGKPTPIERFIALSDAEKDAEVAEFEQGIDFSQWRLLNTQERKLWRKVQRRLRGRPAVGEGAKTIAVSIERGLLKRADTYAKQHAMKRAQMIAEALKLLMQRKSG